MSGGAAGTGGGGLECRSRKSCAAADALSLTGFTSSSRASASSDRTRLHSCSISLMLALSCCRTAHNSQVTQSEILLWCLEETKIKLKGIKYLNFTKNKKQDKHNFWLLRFRSRKRRNLNYVLVQKIFLLLIPVLQQSLFVQNIASCVIPLVFKYKTPRC